MSAETGGPGGKSLTAQVEEAERRLEEAAAVATEAGRRAAAEIAALEADLERERARTEEALEKQRLAHEQELANEREARQEAIAAAERRLSEIESQAEAAEERVREAERRGADADRAVADDRARAREGAAAWLREQLDAIRREAEKR